MSAYALFPPMSGSSGGCSSVNLRAESPTGLFSQPQHIVPASSADSSHLRIVVRDAKLDAALLVQSVVSGHSSPKQQQQRHGLKRRVSPPGLSTRSMHKTAVGETVVQPYEEAVEFELDIRCQDRQYTIRRSLQCISKLRQNLVHEYSDLTIPELPLLDGGRASSSLVGCGFIMLQNMLHAYCPTLESWLRQVVAMIPSESDSLQDFLWEPTCDELIYDFDFSNNSATSLASLTAINEIEDDE